MARTGVLFVPLAFFGTACGGSGQPLEVEAVHEQAGPEGAAECASDADCVPAICCHADRCVPRAQAPDCSEAMCTADCRFNTLDCGGACLCYDGRCNARLSRPPEIGEGTPEP